MRSRACQTPRPHRTATTQARRPYDTDLTDAQWDIPQPSLPPPPGGGRPCTTDRREVLNAISSKLRTGGAWGLLPHDFPPPGTVYGSFSRWRRGGTITRLHDALRPVVREASGHDPEPSAARPDSQSVRSTEVGGVKGFDAGKEVKGRKRHLPVDPLGLVIAVVVTAANVQDDHGARPVPESVQGRCPRLAVIWADGISVKQWLIDWVRMGCGWDLRVIKRGDQGKGFELLPKRWVVERTFGWLGRYRGLSKDDERLPGTSEAMARMAMVHIMVRRLGPTRQDSLASQKEGDEASQTT